MLIQLAAITYRQAKRIVILVIGSTIVLLGIVMIVTPGPAILVIPLGLAVLGVEFAWARRWLAKIKATAASGMRLVRNQLER